MSSATRVLLLVASLLLAACTAMPSALNARDAAITNYGVAIRWSEFDDALQYVDPLIRDEQLASDLERERLKQVQVTGYEVKRREVASNGDIEQAVDIRLISRNTQVERIVTDRQRWRWDPIAKQYWLVSGLPDFTPQ